MSFCFIFTVWGFNNWSSGTNLLIKYTELNNTRIEQIRENITQQVLVFLLTPSQAKSEGRWTEPTAGLTGDVPLGP